MQTTVLNNMVPVVSQATAALASNKAMTNVKSSKNKDFANILSGSVKADGLTASSSSASVSSDMHVHKSNIQSEGTEQDNIQQTTTGQSEIATKENLSKDSTGTEPVADDKNTKTTEGTEDTTPLVDSSALLMMMIQTNTLAIVPTPVTAQASQLVATADQSVQAVGQTANTNEVNTQAALLQMAAAQTKTPAATSATELVTVLSTLSADNSDSLTSDQLTQALKQLTENSQAKTTIPTATTEGVIAAPIETTLNQVVNQSQAVDDSKTDLSPSTSLVDALSDNAKQASVAASDSTKQAQAAMTDNQLQNSNPVLTAFQTQLASKFTVERQGSVQHAKGGVKAADASKNDSSLSTSIVDVLSDKEKAKVTSTQANNTLQFDTSQLSQSSGDGQSSKISDTTMGTFAQALSSEQAHSSTVAVTTTVPQQGTVGKDSFQVMQQIVDQAKLITRAQNTEMVIQLKPEHLGELTLKVTVEQGQVNATFHSNNSDVRSVIESSLAQLKQDLVSSGLKVDNVGVYTGLDQSMSNQQNHSQNQQQLKFTRKGAADNFEDVAQLVEENQSTDKDGVDYRI